MYTVPSPPPGACAARASRRAILLLALAPLARPAHAAADGPAAPIAALYAGLEKVMRAGGSQPFAQRFRAIAPVIDRNFDLPGILALSVGVRWSSLDQPVRDRLFKAFRDFTIASYVANFDRYDGQRFEVMAGERAVGADRVVSTRIIKANGDAVRIDYLVRQHDDAWKVVDVLLDGTISRVAVQRSDFRGELERGGAEALIASLQRKTADLSGGASLGS